VKPGHWIAVSETAKANNFDFAGELATFCEQQATNLPLVVNDTTARLWNWCPAMLPKGQSKRIEAMFYVPRREKSLGRVYSVRSELHGLRGGRTEIFDTSVSPSLRPHEHLIVVLASGSSSPASYTHFDRLHSVRIPHIEADDETPIRYYHVLRPTVDRSAPLPSHPLAWTTIAYVFWDDLDPALLTTFQQQALLDWLHWGGQLVISGPSSLDKLKGSFLDPYLPGSASESVKLEQAAFDELNERYSIARNPVIVAQLPRPPKGENLRRISVSGERPVVGVDLRLNPGAQEVEGTGGLVVERRAGGGRVVVTRFPLTDVRIRQWRSFDNFFNAVLLRRPGREFVQDDFYWDEPALKHMLLEPRLGSTLRYFTRDIAWVDNQERQRRQEDLTSAPSDLPAAGSQRPGTSGGLSRAPVYGAPGFAMGRGWYDEPRKIRHDTSRNQPQIDDWHFAGYGATTPADQYVPPEKELEPISVASWSDDAAASHAARDILTEAAGIEIPSADFVVQVLAVYLLVLVPVNWLVFWLIGKVEWAWVSAPIIAIVGAGAVVRLAQLDIGFARSRTEVAVLEVQGGYERAHLTRYTALYTSLSSSYTLSFDDTTALAAPFPAGKQDESILSITNYTDVGFRRDQGASLAGVQVSSNSTGMVHSEQMLNLGTSPKAIETLRLVGSEDEGFSVSNNTDLVLRDVGVFRRVPASGAASLPAPRIEAAYIPKLEPVSSAVLRFQVVAPTWGSMISPGESARTATSELPTVWLDEWKTAPIFGARGSPAEDGGLLTNKAGIRLTRLARLAADQLRLLPGDVRLIGWTDQALSGMRIRPEAPQNATYTLVIAHLARGNLPPPKPDRNVAEDYMDPTLLEDEPDSAEAPEDPASPAPVPSP
jgi:hypothetical protein